MGGYSKNQLICTKCDKIHFRWGKLCGTCYNQELKTKSTSYRKSQDDYTKKRSEKHKLKNRVWKICVVCKINFGTGYRTQKQCSPCFKKHALTQKEKVEKPCNVCRSLFAPKRRKQNHCSDKCYTKYFYYKRDVEKRRLYNRVREAQDRGATGKYSYGEWAALKKRCKFTCLACKKKEPEIKLTIDHIVPVSKGGSNYIGNLQPLCKSCNSSKSNRHSTNYANI